jgi:hypothetical protein
MQTQETVSNPFPVNPMLIHQIQDRLQNLKGKDLLSHVFRGGASKNLRQTINTICAQYNDNPKLIEGVVGKQTMDLIKEYKSL